MKAFTALLLLFLGIATARAQPACRVFKTFNAVANTGMVQDTINVPDGFPVDSIKVSNMVLGHPDVASLQLSLLHRSAPDAAFTSAALKPAADSVGAFTPEGAGVNGVSTGQWVLKVEDTQPGADQRVISLASWTLRLCPSTSPITAADGPAVSVGVSSSGVSVNVTKDSSAAQPGDKKEDRMAMGKADEHAASILGLLFPGFKDDAAPTGVLGTVSTVKEGAAGLVQTQVTDALDLVAKKSEVYKNFVNKKISDVISGVNAAGTGAQALISNRGGLFTGHAKNLRELVANLKAFVAADAQNKVEHVVTAATQLAGLAGSVTGDLKSSTDLVKQLVVAALTNTGKVYQSVESAAKTHIDNSISAKAALLEGLLDKIIAALSAAEASKFTGPAVDFKLKLDQAALKALAAALDKVDSALKALPTPSQLVIAKATALDGIWKSSRVADLLDAVHEGPVLGRLSDKLATAKGLLGKATAPVVATGGN